MQYLDCLLVMAVLLILLSCAPDQKCDTENNEVSDTTFLVTNFTQEVLVLDNPLYEIDNLSRDTENNEVSDTTFLVTNWTQEVLVLDNPLYEIDNLSVERVKIENHRGITISVTNRTDVSKLCTLLKRVIFRDDFISFSSGFKRKRVLFMGSKESALVVCTLNGDHGEFILFNEQGQITGVGISKELMDKVDSY